MCFQFRKNFFPSVQNIRDPVTQTADCSSDGTHHSIGSFYIPVQVSNVGLDATAFHLRDGRPHVDSRNDVQPLPLIGAEINTLRAADHFKVSVLHNLPAVSPFLSMILLVPVNGIFLVRFPVAGWEPDAFAVLVKVINLSGFGKPFSVFVHRPHGQHHMTMWIVSRWVGIVDGKVTAHSF